MVLDEAYLIANNVNYREDANGMICVMGDLFLEGSELDSLGPVVKVNGDIYLRDATIRSLGYLKEVIGNLDAAESTLEDLGELLSVGGWLSLHKTRLRTLGRLQIVESWLDVREVPLICLGDLHTVGWDIFFDENNSGTLQEFRKTILFFQKVLEQDPMQAPLLATTSTYTWQRAMASLCLSDPAVFVELCNINKPVWPKLSYSRQIMAVLSVIRTLRRRILP
jgi:hypothetical protein